MNSQLANLDTLRSFAVLCVFLNHLYLTVALRHGFKPHALDSLGHAGVLAFFVHTSMVLMFSLERLSREPSRISLRFYINRAFRIYPLAIFSIALMVLFRIPPLPNEVYAAPSNLVATSNLLLVQNFVGRTSILSPLWSLPFEIDMYLTLPLFFLLARNKGFTGIGSALAFFSVAGWTVQHFTGHAHLLAYIPCFLAGVMAYSLRNVVPRISAVWWPVALIFWFGITALAWHKDLGLIPTWIMCALLGFSICRFSDSKAGWWNTFTAKIAKYSYGIYLLHVPAIYAVCVYWRLGDVEAIACSIVLTIFGAIISFHFLEDPCIRAGKSFSARLVTQLAYRVGAAV